MDNIFALIKNEIAANDVVLFMKGNSSMPRCGFSATVCQILNNLDLSFRDIDVLANPDLREGIKIYTDWPTIPQLYVKGEFVGGCDIIKEMYHTGELQELLAQKQLIKKL